MSDARTNNSLPMIHAYLDGELNTAEALAFEQRISDEPAFAAERKRLETLHRVLQEKLPRESAPPDLRRRIERSIGLRAAVACRDGPEAAIGPFHVCANVM